jgi:hypothetical protein
LLFGATRPGKSSQFLLDRSNRFSPKSNEFDPNPYFREAIANFPTSLYFDVRLRQAKSEVYDGAFRKMCRSIHEHPMKAEVGRADLDLAPPAFIAHVKFGQMLDARFSTSRCR